MSLNREQRGYISFLNTKKPEDLCWCGWYLKDECGSYCSRHGHGLTAADKLVAACPDCGNFPWEPGHEITHNIKCPRSPK